MRVRQAVRFCQIHFQQRLDALGGLANEGALSEEVRREYDTYIEAMDVIALLRVKVLSRAK